MVIMNQTFHVNCMNFCIESKFISDLNDFHSVRVINIISVLRKIFLKFIIGIMVRYTLLHPGVFMPFFVFFCFKRRLSEAEGQRFSSSCTHLAFG